MKIWYSDWSSAAYSCQFKKKKFSRSSGLKLGPTLFAASLPLVPPNRITSLCQNFSSYHQGSNPDLQLSALVRFHLRHPEESLGQVRMFPLNSQSGRPVFESLTHTHTHTHIYIYIYYSEQSIKVFTWMKLLCLFASIPQMRSLSMYLF